MEHQKRWLLKLPVLLVHGIFDSGRAFRRMQDDLKGNGWQSVYTLDLSPNDGSAGLTVLAEQIRSKVEEICSKEGADQVDLVAFSMGGLASRYYIKFLGGTVRVRRLVTISSPHHGTWTAFFLPNAGAREMRPGSAFLRELNDGGETPGSVEYTSIWTPLDAMIIPAKSSRLEGAANIIVWNPAHPGMLWDFRVFARVREALSRF